MNQNSELSLLSKTIIAINRIWNVPKPIEYGENIAYWEYNRIPAKIRHWHGIVAFSDKNVLDLGCGWGGETVALSEKSNFVVGVDIEFESLKIARKFAYKKGRQKNTYFVQGLANILPFSERFFDLVYTNDVFEHLSEPSQVFKEIFRTLKPGGKLVVQFGPLFYSPFGYHMQWALTIPWIHLILPLRTIVEIRNAYRHPPIKANSWIDLGLNKMTSHRFKSIIKNTGFVIQFYQELAIKNLKFLLKIPIIRNLFLFGIYAVLSKPNSQVNINMSR